MPQRRPRHAGRKNTVTRGGALAVAAAALQHVLGVGFLPPSSRSRPVQDLQPAVQNEAGNGAMQIARPAAAATGLLPGAVSAAEGMTMGVAPSGVNALPDGEQAAVVLAIFLGLALLSAGLSGPLLGALRSALPEGWYGNWQKTWCIIGAFYMAAGVAHFTAAEGFEAIYPPAGTWGFWYLPGSAQFHVAWTGVAEILGGTGMFLGSLALGIASALGAEPPSILRLIPPAASLGLYALTWCVTPANVYMYTHGAIMTGLTPGDQAIPVEFHVIRGALQVLLLSLLWNFYADNWTSQQEAAKS